MNLTEKIIDKIPNNLETDLEKAFYIYIETCKLFNFDTRFDNVPFLVNLGIVFNHPNINKLDSNRVVCTVWSNIYVDLLKKIGIKASIHNVFGHEGVIIYLSDGNKYYADATMKDYMDLSRVKHNDRILHFYPIDSIPKDDLPSFMNEPNLKKVDDLYEKVGYQVLSDNLIDELKKKLETVSGVSNKMDCIIDNIDLTSFNTIDDTHYLKNIIVRCLDYDYNNVSYTYLKKMEDDGDVKLLWLISLKDGDKYSYYLFDKLSNIKKYSEQEIYEYAKDGYGIPKCNAVSAFNKQFNYPLKYVVPSSSLAYFLKKITFQKNIKKNTYK